MLASFAYFIGKQITKSHGLDVTQQLKDADQFFQNADCAIARKYGASYAFVGPKEDWLKKANRTAFRENPRFEKLEELPMGQTTAEIYGINC